MFEKNRIFTMRTIVLSILVALTVISCNENGSEAPFLEKDAASQTETIQNETSDSTAASSETPSVISADPTSSSTTTVSTSVVAQPPAQNPAQQTGVTAPGFEGKPNPAHGQPGHRCDFQVGEILPYNNASAQTTPTVAAPVINQPLVNSAPAVIQQAATTGVTAPGFSGKPNPAHGQPGHRCDLQVGAILP